MNRLIVVFLLVLVQGALGQAGPVENAPQRPGLVVGIVVDQMRWDFLYRYYDRYSPNGGFRRLLNRGFSCENTFIDYVPTYTGCGHSGLYTGSVPAIHGITGNDWYDTRLHQVVYCAGDNNVSTVGASGDEGRMSPKNLLVTTICDELRIATNFRSKVIGIAIKDRGGILPAGHSANAAYWYDGSTGNFISSTYYMKSLPSWVTEFNKRKLPDQYFKKGWQTLYPLESYVQSVPSEEQFRGEKTPGGFPYTYQSYVYKNYAALPGTPYGNTITKEMAMAAIRAEDMGKDTITDFLAISFSTPDYVGHKYGPNSIEVEDTYLRLDRELGELFQYLDTQVGDGKYLVFISSDHGVAHSTKFSEQKKLPGGGAGYSETERLLDSMLRARSGGHKVIEASKNSQIFLDHRLIDSLRLDKEGIVDFIVSYLSGRPGIDRVIPIRRLMDEPMHTKVRERIANGYYPGRSGDIQVLFRAGYMGYAGMSTTHGSWNPYDAHIPLVWYGWHVKPGKTNRETHMSDVAPTLAAMLRVQMPSGCIGNVIEEVTGP